MTFARRLQLLVVAILLSFLGPALGKGGGGSSTPVVNRDWKLNPAIVELPQPLILYALGDIHGDYDRLVQLLVGAKLIAGTPTAPETLVWTGGGADLVITGDMIDKYGHSMEVLAALRTLQTQVKSAGGRLVVCLGNHEAEFLASGGGDKKGEEFSDELQAAGVSAEDVAAGQDEKGLGAWMRNLPAGARVGDWFFCHAGNTGGKHIDALESELEKAMTSVGYSTPLLIDPNSMLEARMHPMPWWDGTSDPSLHDVKKSKHSHSKGSTQAGSGHAPEKLVDVINALGVKHLVIGHQPGKIKFEDGAVRPEGAMHQHYDGLFFMIDTGMSRGVASGRGALLRIQSTSSGETATAIYADGSATLLWHAAK